jgi:hypothetical protein
MRISAKAFVSVLLLTVGCGSGSGHSNDGGSGSGSWLPLNVGNRWTYQVTDVEGNVSLKVQGVTAAQVVGGDGDSKDMMAFKVVTGNKFNDPNGDISFQALVGARVVRFRELSIDGGSGAVKKEEYFGTPWKLRVDASAAHTTVGMTWPESYPAFVVDKPKGTTDGGALVADAGASADGGLLTTTSQITDVWSVTAVDEPVTVPAGTFKALVVRRTANSGLGTDKSFWFARGVGKVKETGVGEQTEELQSYIFP